MKAIAVLLGSLLLAGGAGAKLPDPTPEAKEKAALTKATNAHKDKVASYQLCQAQNAVATRHRSGGVKGKKVELPACADPGKFDPAQVAAAATTAAPAPAKK